MRRILYRLVDISFTTFILIGLSGFLLWGSSRILLDTFSNFSASRDASALLRGYSSIRETELDIGNGGRLTFSVLWGRGMDQEITISTQGPPIRSATIRTDVWKKPYHAGGPLYANADKNQYYLAFLFGVYHINTLSMTIENICRLDRNLQLDYIGQFGISGDTSDGRGDDVVFTPAGRQPPYAIAVRPDRDELSRNRCG